MVATVTGLVYFQVGARVCLSMKTSTPHPLPHPTLAPWLPPFPHPHSLALPHPTPPLTPSLPFPFPRFPPQPQSRVCSLVFSGYSNVSSDETQGVEHSSARAASAQGGSTEENGEKLSLKTSLPGEPAQTWSCKNSEPGHFLCEFCGLPQASASTERSFLYWLSPGSFVLLKSIPAPFGDKSSISFLETLLHLAQIVKFPQDSRVMADLSSRSQLRGGHMRHWQGQTSFCISYRFSYLSG